jgi:hypothetical protein
MIVPSLLVALMEKPWASLAFKSISTVDLAYTKKAICYTVLDLCALLVGFIFLVVYKRRT